MVAKSFIIWFTSSISLCKKIIGKRGKNRKEGENKEKREKRARVRVRYTKNKHYNLPAARMRKW